MSTAPYNKEISLPLAQNRRWFRYNGTGLYLCTNCSSTAETNSEQLHPHIYPLILNTLQFDSSGVVIFSDLVGSSVSFMTDAIACTFQQHAVPSRIVLQSPQKLRDSDGLMLMDEFACLQKLSFQFLKTSIILLFSTEQAILSSRMYF